MEEDKIIEDLKVIIKMAERIRLPADSVTDLDAHAIKCVAEGILDRLSMFHIIKKCCCSHEEDD